MVSSQLKKLNYPKLLFGMLVFLAIEIGFITWLLSGVEKEFVGEYWEGGKHYLVYERVR